MYDDGMTFLERLKASFAPNYDYRAGTAPLGRNIYGKAGYVDTHFPRTRENIIDKDAAWVDKDGNTGMFSVNGNEFPFTLENWLKIIKPQGDDDVLNPGRSYDGEDELSDEEYWEMMSGLKRHGFFHRQELPDNMFPLRMQSPNRSDGEPRLLPLSPDISPRLLELSPIYDEDYEWQM